MTESPLFTDDLVITAIADTFADKYGLTDGISEAEKLALQARRNGKPDGYFLLMAVADRLQETRHRTIQ